MPLPSSGIIVVEKPSSASITRINSNPTASLNSNNLSAYPPQDHHTEQQTQIQYIEYYDVHENQLPHRQQQKQQQQQSTIVVDATLFHQQQQQFQLGGSSGVAIGRKVHSSSASFSSSPTLSSSSTLCTASTTLLNKQNLQIQTLKAVPMPQTKYSQPQQIIQHTSHTTTSTSTITNPQHHLHQQTQQQHVQQINLAASSIHHQHHTQQQQQQQQKHQSASTAAHMIQVSEEFLEQAANNQSTGGSMMISTTGEVINQQQIFKIVSTDGTTGNMIIDATNQNANSTGTTSKVLLSNLTVLSKQPSNAQGQIIANNHQQPQNVGQTINFVNAKNLYTASTACGNITSGGGKQQKFAVANTNVGSYKSSAIKQSSSVNAQYLQQASSMGQQKINMAAGNRNVQMLTTTTRLQNSASSSTTSNITNSSNSIAVISNNAAPAQTMVLQQPQKFITNTTAGSKVSTTSLGSAGGNVVKKSATTGTLRMNNSHNTSTTATKLMNNLQTAAGVKTFITQSSNVQSPQTQQNINQLTTLQHHATTKSGSKSKFVKQYNHAILNSAGAVAIATLPHQQQPSGQNNLQMQQQQPQHHHQQQLQPQTTYINHHKSSSGAGVGSNKINKINSKYAQSVNMAAQLPPGTQLHQKSIIQSQQQQQQQQQFQTTNSNSNIKFVNAQGTVIQQQQQQQHQQPQQQQSLSSQKVNSKHHHHHHNQHLHQQQQQQYQNVQNFDTVDGNNVFHPTNTNNQSSSGVTTSSSSSSVSSLPLATTTSAGSTLLTDDIMMVNGTQMTDELSARILQSMSQKSFSNQRYHQQQQHVYQSKNVTAVTTTTPTSTSINFNNNNNSNMLPPPSTSSTQNTIVQTTNNSNILLSPREYTLYPTAASSASNVGIVSANQSAQQHSSPIHYNNSSATASSNITAGGSFSSNNNYITVTNNNNNMATIVPHTTGNLLANSGSGTANAVRQAQSAPGSRSQSMERKLHETSMSRKSSEYYKVKIKDYQIGCTFVVPSTAAICATNSTSPCATSLIDFFIPLPSCTTITTTNNITTSSNCATMTTIITNSSFNHNLNQINNNSNHNSLRGNSHHNNIANAAASTVQTSGSLGMTTGNMSASVSNLLGGVSLSSASTLATPLSVTRSPSLPPAALIMEPQAQVIHLQATKTLPGANNSSNDDDDDIIGEEVRPAPVVTDDIRLRILHAVLFDHTYVNPMPLELPTTFAVQLPTAAKTTTGATTGTSSGTGHSQQWSLGGIGAITAVGSGNAAHQNYTLYNSQLSRLHKDIDSYAGLNNNAGMIVGDIDPGEETETAPEGELEDDSITRCICDLTHDDGYMICCDKCCAWQHVDCMGIDRQNIPDEYLCELCQPRIVDKARARSLQLLKRKEQQQQLMLTTQAQTSGSAGTMGAAGSASGGSMGGAANILANDVLSAQQRLTASNGAGFNLTGNMSADSAALKLLAGGGANMKKTKMLKKPKDGVPGKRTKKAEKLAAAAAAGLITNSKPGRKETKKNTKRKKAGAHDGNIITVGMTAAEKHAANLRQWIENYELAVTNHYSPELRARLHAISKQPSLLQSILNTENPILKEFSNGGLENRATTVPHAGGKILISKLDIGPNSPICELRGKYMLTTQYKTQNTSMNMNSPPPNNYHLASYKAHKTPGPFIFFYQLPGSEVASSNQLIPQTTTTTTLNPDGTYTTTTTTLPAQQSPPTFLKGPEICVDTRTYGNEARFVRRSCRPNAEIQHLFEKGTIHLFIVALTDIRASTEITIRHEPHDLLAVDNKKTSSMIIQPTSTACACGLIKDCIFGPPIPQLPPKSNAGRKSLAHSGGVGGSTTAKQRKTNQQNLNRNRSISSSASGDSNMGVTVAAASTIALSLNSPNNAGKMPPANKITTNSNTLMPLTASCNSNLSNASSSSSTLAGQMHDSGVCTSSSSPSVSIPSPTQHMHSPIQQQQQQHQQQQQVHQQQLVAQQLMHNTQLRPTVQLLPQQQQQQIMQTLPTPLVLPSRNVAYQQQLTQSNQQQPLLQQQQPAIIVQQQQQLPQSQSQPQQPINVVSSQATTAIMSSAQDGNTEAKQQQAQLPLYVTENKSHAPAVQHHAVLQPKMLHEQQQPVQTLTLQQSTSVLAVSSDLLDTASSEATIAAVALQTLNASYSPNNSTDTSTVPASGTIETQAPSAQVNQQQVVIVPANENVTGQPAAEQPVHHSPHQSSENKMATASATSINSTTQQAQQKQQSPQQQYKSPQKANHSQNSSAQPTRKTPGKHARATSFSEENDQHSEDNSLNSTPISSTPKEKPKLSREDRKMEAILRAIEKMERNQQKQKQAKRQNSSSSHNTTPTSPNKSLESSESSGPAKRANSHAGAAGRSKKKRKAGGKGGQGGAYNNQRKRRQSRMNSQESVEECTQQDHETVTSESDNCTVTHSPSIQTSASPTQPQFSTSTATSAVAAGSITTCLTSETSNNVDQAAGLLMAFANPNSSPAKCNLSAEMSAQESPQRPASQYMISSIDVAPPTPPSQVSSACLLIEAAVGPLETNLDSNNTEMHSSEFKYPLQAKTKKHLMNSWLHQAEDGSTAHMNASTMPAEQHPQSMHATSSTGISSAAAGAISSSSSSNSSSGGVGVSVGSAGGLDSLLQAAMSDLTQSQGSDQEQPQNLSIAALKVEEFIQQTEASACNAQSHLQTKHSFDYEQQPPHHQRQYANLPTPAVDLTLKTPLTIGPPNVFSSETVNNRNLHLPLQVSTCSNNSSVKKRWLRQAISEETHEEFQQTYAMTSSPTTVAIGNTISNSSQPLQPAATFSSNAAAVASNYVPNGFTTPLKKRRLLLTGKDEIDENAAQNCGTDVCANFTFTSPPPELQPASQLQQQQQELQPPDETVPLGVEKQNAQNLSADAAETADSHEDADVDVGKYEIYRPQMPETLHKVAVALKTELPQDLQYSKVERDQEEEVDVTTSAVANAPILQNEIKMGFKQENDVVAAAEIKQESVMDTTTQPAQQLEHAQPAEFNDQDDDVDILRSPSPGREMIKAEDNLVKIEPEDTSGLEDVKIDVEREEESMAADDFVVTRSKEHKEDLKLLDTGEQGDQNTSSESANKREVKKECNIGIVSGSEALKSDTAAGVESKPDEKQVAVIKQQTERELHEEIEEPKQKRIKLETPETGEESVFCIKKEKELVIKEEPPKTEEESAQKSENSSMTEEQPKQILHSINKDEAKVVVKPEASRKEKPTSLSPTNEIPEVTSSVSSKLLSVKTVAADTTFTDLDSATPPPPLTPVVSGAPIQRNKSLSDDDIQARLHSFHKENILFLQSRNKKTKSSSSSALAANAMNNCLTNNNEHSKSRTSSTSSTSSYNQHHHNHHHHHYHDGKEKPNKLSLKHHKSSSATDQQQGGSTSKKQKLHKRERTTSSSSSSNSHKNSSNIQAPPPSCSSSSVANKNATISSTSASSSSCGSSKKFKSLKKSSSGSSTSSSVTPLPASTLATHNSFYTSSSSTNVTTTTSEKEKDKHNRLRITSTSSGNNNNMQQQQQHALAPNYYPSSKKRQLNFELELTKDLHLLNSSIAGGGNKHKKDATRLLSDDQSHVAAKKSRKATAGSMQKEELRCGSNKAAKTEKQPDKKSSSSTTPAGNTSSKQIPTNCSTSSNMSSTTPATTNTPTTATTPTPTEEPRQIPTIIGNQPPQAALTTAAPILREHPTLPHFNNVIVVSNSCSLSSHEQLPLQSTQPTLAPVQSQTTPSIPPQSIPNHVISPSFKPTVQVQQPPLPPTPSPPTVSSASSPVAATPNVNPGSQLPFYNTIYGKLLDNSTPLTSAATPLASVNASGPAPPAASAPAPSSGSGVLSEYLDTKLKSYSTLGGYVSHSALFGLGGSATAAKESHAGASAGSSGGGGVGISSPTTVCTSAAASTTLSSKDSASEMPAPLAPASSSSIISLGSGNTAATALVMPLKIHTKTASHDPRLNPQLTAPEPPPQPKRKLSINEYRKRMQQSSSNDSNCGSGSLTTTPTTPPTSLESSPLLGPMAITTTTTSKCTLYSPDRLTQSVDSQIQKEIMSTTSAASSSSSSSIDSLNSSNSSTTSLNDTLLKSSSFVEEDSTKGQFNAAPTLLEKQQESLCARLKSLKEKQSLGSAFSVGSAGNRSRFSSFSESVASSDFGLRKDEDEVDILRHRNISISSSLGGGDLLDNCLEEISSTSTSMSSSREPSPERSYTGHQHKILTASATATSASTSATTGHGNSMLQTTRHHHQQHTINCDKNDLTSLERKRSVDIA